jgi:nitrate reductase delta subunit
LQTLRSEALLPEKIIKKVETFLTAQKVQDLMAVQEDYVETFDRGRAHCLHLFEHIHGESRDRGQAMVDLSETYAAKGLHIDSSELPDYLPLFMEYLSRCELQDATELLGEAIDVIAVIGAKLKKRKSPYADIFTSIEALSVVKADTEKIKTALREAHKDPETLEELDKQWKEAEAFTGNPLSDVAADSNTCNAFPNTMEALNKIAGGKK